MSYLTPADDGFLDHLWERYGMDLASLDFDPAKDGLRIVEEERAREWPGPGGKGVGAIEGFCQITSVTRDGITSRILKRWPDRVREKVGVAPN